MPVLILHASLGAGHQRAAEALGAAFGRLGAEPHVVDVLDYVNPSTRRIWKGGYRRMSAGAPLLYRLFYAASDAPDEAASVRASLRNGRLSRAFLADLSRLVAELAPAAVVCTMQFPLMLMSHLRERGELRAPLYVAVTDFVAHGSWIAAHVDGYFLPSPLSARLFARKGVDPALLHVTGIPISPEAAEPKEPAAMRRRHGLPAHGPVITLFGGGLDPGRVRMTATRLLALPAPATLVTVAGRNAELAAHLADLAPGPQVGLLRLGPIDYVDDLLAASDLAVGKPGGLTTSEALARGVPLLIIDPIPGQEEWNADYVCGAGAGVQLRQIESVPLATLGLLRQPARLAAMAEQARLVGRPRAALEIAAAVLGTGATPRERAVG